MSDGAETDILAVGEGTALDSDHISLTQENAWTFTFQGETSVGETICTNLLTRVGHLENRN